jgi:hypothetical protein
MPGKEQFREAISKAYQFSGPHFKIGTAMLNGEILTGTDLLLPLKTMNRHGLIAGATGTGKTKTLQVLAEGLSDAGVPVVLMDIKGDLSGIAAPGIENDKIRERVSQTGGAYQPRSFPVELMSLSEVPGVRLRSTVTEFGPVLLSRILGLNETQESIVSVLFKYSDDHAMPLIDLKDFNKLLQYSTAGGKKEIEAEYGRISAASTGTIMRKVIELQQQGADLFFGEPSFEVDDLMRTNSQGKGIINILRITDMQNRPKLFSTFMLSLLAELYAELPEAGDMEKPKLVFFIDEAHLVFQEANTALLQQIETVVKLIRSKGVGIFFCTQNPQDIPASVLSQLGLKIQHALRAFTAADRKSIKQAAENYPETEYYDTDQLITQLGIGEAFVTLLNEKGIPAPLVHTLIIPPSSRMDILTDSEIASLVRDSDLAPRYARSIDSESAYEMLTEKMQEAAKRSEMEQEKKDTEKDNKRTSKEETFFDNTLVRQVGRTAASIITRSLLGALGIGSAKSRRKG